MTKYFKDFRNYIHLLSLYTKGYTVSIIVGITLGIIAQICGLATPFLTKYLIDIIIVERSYVLLNWFLILSIIILIVLFGTTFASNYILIKVFKQAGLRLKMDLFRNLQQAPLEFFGETPSGEISYRLFQDAGIIETSWSNILVTIPLQVIFLFAGAFMILWDLKLALFVFVVLGLQIIVIVKFRNPLLRYSERIKAKDQEVAGYAVEHFKKIQLIRSLSTENIEQNRFFKKMQDLINITIKSYVLTKISQTTVTVVNNLWAFGVLWYGGGLVIAGEMTLGTLMAFLLLANILYQPISTLTNLVLSFQDIKASLRRFLEYTDVKPNVVESSNAVEFVPKRGDITLKDVTFGYNQYQQILKNINLKISSNSIFALVGRSGVGKTTICRLLVRFYDPQGGSIYLDEKNIKDITIPSLRSSVLLMLQNDYVFSGTILENITYGSKVYTKEEVYNAAKKASLDFVENLPAGFDTKIGTDGINLSVGEAQRIALARAFLFAPKVLILDEPTSFVDVETEEKLKKSLLELKRNTTIILIAHRLSTVMIADKIGVIDDGKVVEVGSHDELIKKEDSIYKKIYLSIFSK